MSGPDRLRERVALIDPRKLTFQVPVADVRETLERLATAEAAVERLEFEAKQRLLFETTKGASA